jgi:hypothetical protein
VLEVSFNLAHQGYDEAKGREFYRQIVERLESLPGAQSACVTNMLPLGFMALPLAVVPEGREIPPNERPFPSSFTAQDAINSTQVAIVSEKLALRLWPEIKDPGEALGRKRARANRSGPAGACDQSRRLFPPRRAGRLFSRPT